MLTYITVPEDEPCPLNVIIDMAVEFREGLGNGEISSLAMAKQVLHGIALRLSIEEVVVRIGHSAYPIALLEHTRHIFGTSIRDRRRVVRAVYNARKYFDANVVTSFADDYFTDAFRERLKHDDVAGAWNMVKLATNGSAALDLKVDAVLKPYVKDEPIGMLVSLDCGRRLVQDMHARLMFHKLVPDILKEQQPGGVNYGMHWPAGIMVAQAVGGYDPNADDTLNALGLQALAVARHVGKLTVRADDDVPEPQIPAYG